MSSQPVVAKWYTRARKFPQLIGRTADGARLWGGPYTITQVVAAGGLLLVGSRTMTLWARFGFLGNALVGVGVLVATVWGLGRVPPGVRNPISVMTCAWLAVAAPATGRLGGRPVKIGRPRRLRHRVRLYRGALPAAPAAPAVSESSFPASSPATPAADMPPVRSSRRPGQATATRPGRTQTSRPPRPALTGVQALLASPAPGAPRLESGDTRRADTVSA